MEAVYNEIAPLGSKGGFDTDLNPAPTAFMILEDKAFRVHTGAGTKRTFPAGTFIIKTLYRMRILKVTSGTTAIGANSILLGYE